MSLQLGVFSGALREWSPEQIASAAAQAGLETIEWEVGAAEDAHISLASAERDALRCLAASTAAGLSVRGVGAHGSVSISSPQDAATVLLACSVVGGRQARMFAPEPDSGSPVRSQLDALAQTLREFQPELEARGLTLLIEVSPGTLVPSPELFLRVCEGLPPERFGILYDPANMLDEGNLEPGFAIDLMGAYLRHVHLKNASFAEGPEGWTTHVVEVDRGAVDWRAVFGELERFGYAGAVVIDHLSGAAEAARLRADAEAARRLWNERRAVVSRIQ